MTQAQRKEKTRRVKRLKNASNFQAARRAGNAVDQEQLAQSRFWKEEVKALSGMQFQNIAHALEVLIDRVLCRFDLAQADRQETREFLMLLFDTDEEIKEELARVLRVGKG